MSLGSKSISRLCGLATVGWLVACSDTGAPCPECTASGVIVSNPSRNPAADLSPSASISSTGVADGVAYVSLPPGTVPGGNIATIQNRRTGATSTALLVVGGFDPVPIPASSGDTLDVDIQLFDGGQVRLLSVVPIRRPPVIVRTDPPPRKRDVPLTAAMVIVFSEPIDTTTLTATSVRLVDESGPVPAHLDLTDSTHVRADLLPDVLLAPNTTYTLEITSDVRDLSGDALAAATSVEFTTAASASVRGQIAFTKYDGQLPLGSHQGIFAINPDGTGMTFLVDDYGNTGTDGPSWSPDGRQLAFSSNRPLAYGYPGSRAIYVINADGSGLTRLTNSPASAYWPAWSPDGEKIAFAQYTPEGPSAVYTMNVDGSGVTRLTNQPQDESKPTWSPDGARIAFVRGDSISDIFVMNADGSNQQRLTDGQFPVATPAWSPDGSRIAYARAPASGSNPAFHIHVMNADGSNVRQLTNGPAMDWCPTWSPDGQQIVFASEGRDAAGQQLFLINADGSGLTRLTDDPFGATQPSWSHAPSR